MVGSGASIAVMQYALRIRSEKSEYLEGINRFNAKLSIAAAAENYISYEHQCYRDSDFTREEDTRERKRIAAAETEMKALIKASLSDAEAIIPTSQESLQFALTHALLKAKRTVFLGDGHTQSLRKQATKQALSIEDTERFQTLYGVSTETGSAFDEASKQQLLQIAYDAIPHLPLEKQLSSRIAVYNLAEEDSKLKQKVARKILDEVRKFEGQARYEMALRVLQNSAVAKLADKAVKLAFDAISSFPEIERFDKIDELISLAPKMSGDLKTELEQARVYAIGCLEGERREELSLKYKRYDDLITEAKAIHNADARIAKLTELWEHGIRNRGKALVEMSEAALIAEHQTDSEPTTPASFLAILDPTDKVA